MNGLQDILAKKQDMLGKQSEKSRSFVTTEHQVQGLYYAKKLHAPKEKYGMIMKLCKNDPRLVERAYSFVSDYPNARDLLKLFFWKYWDLKRSNTDHK